MDDLGSVFTYGCAEWNEADSKAVAAAGILGGPLVTVSAILVLGGTLATGVDGSWFVVVGNLLLSESVRAYRTIVPRTYSRGRYEGSMSDGKRFLQLLRS